MKRNSNFLIGDAQHFTFEQRIFNFVILLSICMAIFGTAMDVYYKVGVLIDLMFTGCWILTYYFARFHGCFNIVSVVSTFIFIFAYFPYGWISGGGSSGTLPCYAIVFVAIICIILKGRFRAAMVASMLVVNTLLIFRDIYRFVLDGNMPNGINMFFFGLQILFIMAAMSALIIIYSSIYMREKSRGEAYAKTIEENYLQQLYYMNNLEELIDRLKSERHDFNNHLGVIYGLLEAGDADKAGIYVSQLVKTADKYRNLANIPYPMIRAILNYKLSVAKEKAIALKLVIDVPEGLALNEFDLTVILGNLLDNAIEACMTVHKSNRNISLHIFYKPDYLVIQTENPVNESLSAQPGEHATTKADPENHGFGLRNIEYLTKKHNGFLKIGLENGVFKADIALLAVPACNQQ
jgi:hypothetical protein